MITEPAADGQVVSPFDVHMVAAGFVGAPGENHVCSDWEIRTSTSNTPVWSAACATGVLRVHIHLGDGQFSGPLAGRHQLDAESDYRLRVRFQTDQPPPDGSWTEWAERTFRTASAYAIEPLVVSEASSIPLPGWTDGSGDGIVLPPGAPGPVLRLEVPGGGAVLELEGLEGVSNRVTNPPALTVHGPLHVVCEARGASAVAIPESILTFTDGSGQDRAVYLPAISLTAGQMVGFWIGESGGAFTADAILVPGAAPNLSVPVTASPIPWAVKQPGYRVEPVATGFQLPVSIAFIPNRGTDPEDPLFYVTELYGSIQMVTSSGQVSEYATGLLNFDPTGGFPGSGEKGLTGIVVEPQSGDVFASMVEAIPPATEPHFPRVVRLHSTDGGRTAASQTTILDFPADPVGPSHQTSNLTFGPDVKLYVHIGDGFATAAAQDLASVRGKILRVNLDGSAPPDNPFFDAADGISAKDLVFAYGFRNPFGGAWRDSDGAHWEVENGPLMDRLAKVVAGRNYLWDGTDASMTNYAAYNWPSSHAPVSIAFVQPSAFGGSGFPQEKTDHAFVSESGGTYASGPQATGKRVSEFVLDPDGNLVSGPVPLIEYIGAGRATVSALAAGPDGLYFADLYKDFGAASPVDAGASVFRIRYVGVADFSASVSAGDPPLTVAFEDQSNVPGASAWHWDLGDGSVSDERNPVHTYLLSGRYDVRLTVTGPAGAVARQKPALVVVAAPGRDLGPLVAIHPTPRVVGVRP